MEKLYYGLNREGEGEIDIQTDVHTDRETEKKVERQTKMTLMYVLAIRIKV